MQFSLVALLGLSALAVAAPAPVGSVEDASFLVARTSQGACCPKGKHSSCSPCSPEQKCPSGKPDKYTSCNTIGLINVVVCNVLNDNTISIPITLDLLSS